MAKIEQLPPFVISALLAGRLYRMLEITKVMYISSSNAKCISIRGGDKTAGFKPITEFISDMARDTISTSSKINAAALKFSRTAVNEKRTNNALNKYYKAIEKLESESNASDIKSLIERLHVRVSELKQSQAEDCKYLSALFDDVSQGIRAAKVIVTNSRTEASRAGEYQTNLFAIANDLEGCSDDITSEIKVCKTYLEDLTKMTGK